MVPMLYFGSSCRVPASFPQHSSVSFGARIPKRSLRRNSESSGKAEVLTVQKRGIEGEDKVGSNHGKRLDRREVP